MNCPECGSQISSDQQFCRSCGAGLLADESLLKRFSPLIGLLLAFGGILIALTGRMLLNDTIIVYLGVVTAIIGMMSIAMIPLAAAASSKKRKARVPAQPEAMAPAEPTMKLPPMRANDSIPSVTDNTTALLKEPIQKRTTNSLNK